ncbi:MAG: BrnT family toxin [Candidatus Limnocylindrales bacterium]
MAGPDPRKAIVNLRKHGIGFAEARSVLRDRLARWEFDTTHSDDEERWRVTGRSNRGRVLVVTVTPRAGRFRVISARRATKRECHDYEG